MKSIGYSNKNNTECHRAVQQETEVLWFFISQMQEFVVENAKLKLLLNVNHLNKVPT